MKNILCLYRNNTNFIKYSCIGLSGALLDFILFNLLIKYFDLNYQYANIISVCAGITNNYFLNAFFNFRVKSKLLKRYFSFLIIGLFGLLLNALLLYIFIEKLYLGVVFSKAIIIFVVAITQYFLNVKLTFRTNRK
ncbi:MAG: GtrA family protein [Candidatus Cloacimonetes bacterium]|nr:GtrA family protein [Candidatus Cloacimonadota bacterium]